MSGARRTYVRLYDDLNEHPAWEDLDLQHVGLWVLALGYCSRNLTDGHVSARRLAKLGGTPETITELVDAGRLHAVGHDCSECPQPADGALFVHNYLAHQRSKEDAEARSAKAKTAGQMGGLAKAKRFAKQTSGESVAETETKTKKDTTAAAAADPVGFDAWWTEYPRKTAKTAAAKSYAKALKDATPEQLLDGLRNAVQAWRAAGTAPQYVPHPTTWLNQGRWADEQPIPGMPERPQAARPSRTLNLCDGTDCPGIQHEWTDSRNTFVCMGVTA